MNTIFWKGVSSTTIDGLLICELPPISKPPMRVKETIIDGRDGSTIEDLGYAPYDKAVTIGLRGNFNINKVIKYFTGEGEIIFSNEPDKVYTAKVISQIDYNRLLRFRKAVVKFRVQPFKHKYNEAYKETQTATATGTSIVVTDSAEANLKAFSIYGKSTQDGTPTPDAPVDIVSLGADGSVKMDVMGGNLIQYPYKDTETFKQSAVVKDNGAGILTFDGDFTGNFFFTDYNFKVKKGVTYTFSIFGNFVASKNLSFWVYSETEGDVTLLSTASAKSITFTPTKDISGVAIYVHSEGTTNVKGTMYPQFRIGNATEYEAYKIPQSVSLSLQTGFRGIPVTDKSLANYTDVNGQMWCADEIDLERGVYIQRVIPINAGEQYWTINTTWSGVNTDCNIAYFKHSNMKYGNFLCTHFSKFFKNSGYDWVIGKMGMQETGVMYASIAKSAATTNDGVKQYMTSLGAVIYCVAVTPIETALTAEQIAVCKALKANYPTTTFLNDENAYMKVQYIKHFEVFNEGLENSKPIMVLHGNGTVGISVNGVHIFDYTFPEGETEVVIDSEKEDAYLGEVLKNRNMNGEFPVLLAGTNKIEWSGDVESIEILPRSRWL